MKIRPVGAKFCGDGRTDRHNEANSRFSQFCERAHLGEQRVMVPLRILCTHEVSILNEIKLQFRENRQPLQTQQRALVFSAPPEVNRHKTCMSQG
jgi:hypothetical protein